MRQGDFSPSQLPVQTLSRCLYSPQVESVRVLKIPNAGSHTTVWEHKNIAHADTVIGMGSAALVSAVPYPGKASLNFPGKASLNFLGKASLNFPGKASLNFPGKASLNFPGKASLNFL